MTVKPIARTAVAAPDDLIERDQWVVWRYETREGKPTKVPYQVNGKRADSTQPATWTSFEAALSHWHRFSKHHAGIGFVFSKADPFTGVDLDDCLAADGNVKPWARGMVERFGDTYTEISPGGSGLKLWARGSLPANLPGVREATVKSRCTITPATSP